MKNTDKMNHPNKGGRNQAVDHSPPRHARLFSLLVPAFLLATPAHAGEGDTFRPVLQYSFTHEDNVFRIADNTTLAPGFSKSDSYQSLGAGFDVDWKQGRQQVLVNALFTRTSFKNNSTLDYDGQNATGEWRWTLGNRLRGTLGTQYNVYLGGYDNTAAGSNVRTQRRNYVTGTYWFHPNWQAELRYNLSSLSYDSAAQASYNYTNDETTAGLFYKGGQMERLGFEIATTKGRYPDRSPPSTINYDTDTVRLVAN